jgi:hypothetical protein
MLQKLAESEFLAVEASTEGLEFIVRHAAGKNYQKSRMPKLIHYAKDLKYPRGSLVFNGTDEEEQDAEAYKDIFVCREMAKHIGFPKLKVGLSAMSKDELVDNLAYNRLKVYIYICCKISYVYRFYFYCCVLICFYY